MSVLEVVKLEFDAQKTAAQKTFYHNLQSAIDNIVTPWYELEGGGIKGAKSYRKQASEGWGGKMPKPVMLDDRAKTVKVPSSNGNPNLFLRMIKPATKESRGVYLHIHGGKNFLF